MEAKKLASKQLENHIIRDQPIYYDYFQMREKQFMIIERMLPLVASLPFTVKQGKMIADFLEEMCNWITISEVPKDFMQKLIEMRLQFQNMELPKTREEFEVRAALLQLTREIEEYLELKASFKDDMKSGKERKEIQKV